jgi:2-dehydropantoate 2-reductase
MSIQKVIVLGAGAIGSLYGALLSKKVDVLLVGRKPHVEAISSKGLRLTGEINQTFSVEVDTQVRKIPPNTLLLLTTKAQDSIQAINQIKSILRADTVILVLQNGLGNEKVIKEVVGWKVEVLRGLTMMASEFLKPGEIQVWKGVTILAKSRTANEIASLFNECGLKTKVSENITEEIWRKLALNCVINPLTALFQVRNREIASQTLEWVRQQILRECVEVARAEGVSLKIDPEELDRKIKGYANFSSMCQDIIKGKKTEIDFLNGKIIEIGQKHGIPTPVNRTLTCLIKFLEEKNLEVRR